MSKYLTEQLITCIGNKRSMLVPIESMLKYVCDRLGKSKLYILDAFSGSGVVSRLLKGYASLLICNDLESYAFAISQCYMSNKSDVDLRSLNRVIARLNECVRDTSGFITDMYAPKDEGAITTSDRVFYSIENARLLDYYCSCILKLPEHIRYLLLGPLLSEASIHVNTSGVFKGFYKNSCTGIGQFGGNGCNALTRILGRIVLAPPILSDDECEYKVFQQDANSLVHKLRGLDLTYIDPPYNQHPYGSNYFMLNLLVKDQKPKQVSKVSGIPVNWQRSEYNKRLESLRLLEQLLETVDTKFILLSFSNDGFINLVDLISMLRKLGKVKSTKHCYNAFRGGRNNNERNTYVVEGLFLVEKG